MFYSALVYVESDMKDSNADNELSDAISAEAIGDMADMFDHHTLKVISTLISAIRANNDGRIDLRDRLMREAVQQYDQQRTLH